MASLGLNKTNMEKTKENRSESLDFRDYFYEWLLENRTAIINESFPNNTNGYTTVDYDIEPDSEKEYNYWALLLLFFPLLALFGNVLVIISVATERALQSATNYFIVNLAIADLLVAAIVMPFGVYYLFVGEWGLPPALCDWYIAMDVTCSSSSIFNLVAISVDRYIAVTKPIKYAKHKSGLRVGIMIAMSWIVACAIGAPAILGLNNTPTRNPLQCIFNSPDYVIYSSFGSFYIPCFIMMVLYQKIFKAIRERAKKQRSAKNASGIASAVASGTSAVVIENVAQTRRYAETSLQEDRPTNTVSGSDDEESIMANLASPIPVMDPSTVIDSGYGPSNIDTEIKECSPTESPKNKNALELVEVEPTGECSQEPRPRPKKRLRRLNTKTLITTPRRRFRTAASVARFTIFKANRTNRLRAKSFAKKEKKATQTLAIVLGVFLICWAPFFTCSILDALSKKYGWPCSPGMNAFIVTTWLGYINSFLNPLIYTIFNLEFRKAFRRIMKCIF